jgi:PIN domain nuclease of toxin-antitoxin system
MRILLDTHVLIWALSAPERLDAATRSDIESTANVVLFSAASIWEIAIKAALRRADFDVDPDEIVREAIAAGFLDLAVSSRAAAGIKDLPLLHGDPFDRLLVAQAIVEQAVLLTADRALAAYPSLVRLI